MDDPLRIRQLRRRLAPHRAVLLEHPLYGEIDRLDKLRVFMEHHIFAVWDFMSLLKSLQRSLCCVEVPWLPPADPLAARLVNEIVLGEESDADGRGGYASHFDLYHRAMQGCGADMRPIDGFLASLRQGRPLPIAVAECDAPRSVRSFVEETFRIIETGDICAIAAAFTFGREDLLPDVFQRIVDELNLQTRGDLEDFKFYLDRHIELDGDHHGPLAARMIASLCGEDECKWRVAEEAAEKSLQARRALWDGMRAALGRPDSQSPAAPSATELPASHRAGH